MDRHVDVLANTHGIAAAPITPQMFAGAGKEHMQKYGEPCSWRACVIQFHGVSAIDI